MCHLTWNLEETQSMFAVIINSKHEKPMSNSKKRIKKKKNEGTLEFSCGTEGWGLGIGTAAAQAQIQSLPSYVTGAAIAFFFLKGY